MKRRNPENDRQPTAASLLEFWFDPRHEKLWFNATPEFDRQVRAQFEAILGEAKAGQLEAWEQTPEGSLALVILLDQMPLNMYRGEARSFDTEALAREVTDRALARQFDQRLPDKGKAFLYMPFMHSEQLADQDRSVALYEAAGLERNLDFARHHRNIVRRFGRFPHRNAILGRPDTAEEEAWLASDQAFHG